MKTKIKPYGLPCFAIGNVESGDFYYYDEGPNDGMILAFPSRQEAADFICINELEGEAFVVDLTNTGTK